MHPALVSIIIPCYNAERWLAHTLESALHQTWPRCEIIVVDDGSGDRSAEIASSYATRGVRLLRQQNRGASTARNAGWAVATGDYVQWLDADDLLSPTKIESQISLLLTENRLVAATCRWLRFRRRPIERVDDAMPVFRDFEGIEFAKLTAATGVMMHPAAWLMSRSLVEAAGPWDERLTLNDDGEYFSRVALTATGIRYCLHGEVYIRSYREGSLSRRRDAAACASQFLSVDLIVQRLLAADSGTEMQRACADLYQRSIYLLYPPPKREYAHARERIAELGGSTLKPSLGPRAAFLAHLVGLRGLGYLRWLRASLHRMAKRERSHE